MYVVIIVAFGVSRREASHGVSGPHRAIFPSVIFSAFFFFT